MCRPIILWLCALSISTPVVTLAEQPDFSLQINSKVPSLKLPADLDAQIVLENPLVANPLYIHFDARGRLWLVEYRQYPWPAGLRLLSRDAVWRNRYEPAFAPPPPHAHDSPFLGKDRISIHEDTDGDGNFDQSKVFLDGLNFATAALPGRGGVFVMNPPYLLFYADRNKDDVPDDPEPRVLLSGFGIEDSHSIANSLRWGPDGWIYATQGSTVSGSVVRHGEDNKPLPNEKPVHSLGQNLWRYHPEDHRYEIFAEGGGNAFGVEVDSLGHVYSGHNGGNTRGFHYIQGGYFQKTFGKHGELSNPFTFGYFPDMQHHDVKRFSHTFVIYESTELPQRYHGKLFGVNPVENYIIHSKIESDGSSRRTADVATILEPGQGPRADWFTPVDVQVGPDGAMYVADWYSVQANHYRNHEGETNPELGRVIRVSGKNQNATPKFDLESLASNELVDKYLRHPNRWFRHQTLRILGDRKDANLHSRLFEALQKDTDKRSLETLWALNLSGGLSSARLLQLLNHPNAHVRRWCIRLWGDAASPRDEEMPVAIAELAKHESSSEVISQIICTARRLTSKQSLPIVASVMTRDEFSDDIHIPLSLWWAIESIADEPAVRTLFSKPAAWTRRWNPSGSTLSANLVRRYVTMGDQTSLKACASLMQIAPSKYRNDLHQAFAKAIEGRRLPTLPSELEIELAKSDGVFATILSIRRGDEQVTREALDRLAGNGKPFVERDAAQIISAVGDTRALSKQSISALLAMLDDTNSDGLLQTALVALQKFDATVIGEELVKRIPKWSTSVRETAESTLASRSTWATQLLDAVENGTFASLQPETIDRLRLHQDPELQERVAEQFPLKPLNDVQLANQTAKYLQTINEGQGQPLNGKALFFSKANCGKCHQLFAQGGEIGPDLTPYNRTKIRDMLLAIVSPSAEIREGFESHTAITSDGQVIAGLKIEENDQLVVLRGVDGQNHSIPTDELEEISASKQSLMPAGLLDELTDDEVRDLFAYLVSTTPPK